MKNHYTMKLTVGDERIELPVSTLQEAVEEYHRRYQTTKKEDRPRCEVEEVTTGRLVLTILPNFSGHFVNWHHRMKEERKCS